MARKSEPNAQNSELKPEAHPSGARIEKMMNEADREQKPEGDQDTLLELGNGNLRPSERYSPPLDEAKGEGERQSKSPPAPHRNDRGRQDPH